MSSSSFLIRSGALSPNTSVSKLFRPAAMAKISNPDRLDEVLQVVRPLHIVGIAVVTLVLVAGFIWSIVSSAAIKVQGQGILLSSEGVADVTAPSTGRLQQILVQPGDWVRTGQTLALLNRPTALDALTAKHAELQDGRSQLELQQTLRDNQQERQSALTSTKRNALDQRLQKLQEQRNALQERRRNESELHSKGFVTSSKINDTDTRLAELDNQMAAARNNSTELGVQQQAEETQKVQQLRETQGRVASLERQVDNMAREYERDRIVTAPTAGSVVELSLNPGDLVATGTSVMRLLSATAANDNGAVHAIIFVSNNDGKKVKEGMPAQIMPSTTKLQKDGFIHGTVIKVAKIPSSREGMMRRLKNATLVDSLLSTGAPFEMEIALDTTPQSPSGYRWSSGDGPDISIDVGTMAEANMVVGQQRIISLILPAFDHIFRWLGVH